jgi:hypothetical protein
MNTIDFVVIAGTAVLSAMILAMTVWTCVLISRRNREQRR